MLRMKDNDSILRRKTLELDHHETLKTVIVVDTDADCNFQTTRVRFNVWKSRRLGYPALHGPAKPPHLHLLC